MSVYDTVCDLAALLVRQRLTRLSKRRNRRFEGVVNGF
jgi:hypothetical protein